MTRERRLPYPRAALLSCLAGLAVCAFTGRVDVLHDAALDGWEEKSFQGHTSYEPAQVDGVPALRARSHGTASGLYRHVRIDLEATPFLHWRWRVQNVLEGVDERTRSGDDYAARVYVIRSGGLFFWRTTSVSYVWSSARPAGSTWRNAYTGNVQMVAVRSGRAGFGRWQDERRDVRADFRRLLGEDVRYIDAVAIMTDTDDSGQRAAAYYGDIWFAAE